MRISVWNSRELQATILAMKALPAEISKEVRAETKKIVQPIWQEAVRGNTRDRLQVRVLADTARASVTNKNVTLTAGTIGKALSGGATPADLTAGTEFGSQRYRQFGTRTRKGKVVYQAAAEVIPRLASAWIQTVIRTTHEQLEKGARRG